MPSIRQRSSSDHMLDSVESLQDLQNCFYVKVMVERKSEIQLDSTVPYFNMVLVDASGAQGTLYGHYALENVDTFVENRTYYIIGGLVRKAPATPDELEIVINSDSIVEDAADVRRRNN